MSDIADLEVNYAVGHGNLVKSLLRDRGGREAGGEAARAAPLVCCKNAPADGELRWGTLAWTTIYNREGVVVEMFCPTCGVSLKVEGDKCDFCFSPMFALYLPNGGILEGCLKSGCHQHKLVLVDVHEQLGMIHGHDQIQLLM